MNENPELHRNPDTAVEMAANAVLNYMRQCGMDDEQAQQAWIAKVFDAVNARRAKQ